MALEFGDRKLSYVNEAEHLEKIEESSLRSFFYDLEPSDMNAVDACKVSKVWVG